MTHMENARAGGLCLNNEAFGNWAAFLVSLGSREGFPGQCDYHHWYKHGSPGFEALTMKLARDKGNEVGPDPGAEDCFDAI